MHFLNFIILILKLEGERERENRGEFYDGLK